jgi:hypothetical protein
MGDSDGCSEDQNVERNADSADCAQEVSDGHEDSTGGEFRGHLCYMLAKNLATFCPCPETLREAEFEGDRLINVVEEISRQSSI